MLFLKLLLSSFRLVCCCLLERPFQFSVQVLQFGSRVSWLATWQSHQLRELCARAQACMVCAVDSMRC
eukprot:m.292035 g.292035  ORF g.292035 m.292035 type:complete len:68 (-) comp15833_c0_seq1:7086-7289(-)